MTRPDLLALAERVERATDPDRELDAEIAVAVLGGKINWYTTCATMEMYPVRRYPSDAHRGGFGREPVPAYTESLDAVMTLLPKGWDWLRKNPPVMTVYAIPPNDKTWATHIDGIGATPNLALLAAILRARAAMEDVA